MDADPALCAVEIGDPDDLSNFNSARFDLDDCAGKGSGSIGRSGHKVIPGLAYWRRCLVARIAARQRAMFLANAVDGYVGTLTVGGG